jgi:DNA-binding transcriptional LysR family regulator
MALRHLRYFQAAAEEQHFGRAANRLRISQPAMSRQIMDLESEVGVQLFERLPRGVRLSPAGQEFLNHTRQIAVIHDQACEFARRAARGQIGQLRVGFNDFSIRYAVVPASFKIFRATVPGVRLDLIALSSTQQKMALQGEAIDAGYVYYFDESKNPAFTYLPLGVEKVLLALPKSHHLAKKRTLRPADLENESFIWIHRQSMPDHSDQLTAACLRGGLTPRVVQETHNESTLLRLVSVEMGIGLVRSSLRTLLPDNVMLKPVAGISLTIKFGLIWRPTDDSYAVQRFIEVVQSLRSGQRHRVS